MPSSSAETAATASPSRFPAAGVARSVRWGLAALWIVDALLQLQPALLSRQFGEAVLYPAALMYQPPGLHGFLLAIAHLVAPRALPLSLAAALLQLAIGLGILHPRTRRLALGISIVWALLVWVGGEGLGFMATGTALFEFGAPGAALLYAALAWVVWPAPRRGVVAAAGLGRMGDTGTRRLWTGLWLMAAVLHFQPPYASGAVLAYNFQSAAQEQPGKLALLDYHLAGWGDQHALLVALVLALLEVGLGLAVWSAHLRRPGLLLAALLTLLFWVFCQALGGLLTGSATDLSTAPAVLLLALVLYPRAAAVPVPDPAVRRCCCWRWSSTLELRLRECLEGPAPVSQSADSRLLPARRQELVFAAARIILGAILLVDAAMEWQPATYQTYPSHLYSNASVSPWPLEPLLVLAAQLWARDSALAGALLAALVTLLGLCLLFGAWTRIALWASLPLFLAIWLFGQGLGLPLSPGATDLGSGILYLLYLGLLLGGRSWRRLSVDAWLGSSGHLRPARLKLALGGSVAVLLLLVAAVLASLAGAPR